MEQRRDELDKFNLKEWSVKACLVSRENTSSRRFSASNLRSFREDTKSFRTNFTISSTASSPGYTLGEEINPTTYSFTTALRALKARSVYSWEISSPDGFALNSKWSEAEKYICNPLSGEVPIECLSAKTLSGRYIPRLAGRVTMSAPLIYSRAPHPKSPLSAIESEVHFPIPEINMERKTRDAGTQSTPKDVSSSSSSGSPSPAPTPSIEERSIQRGSEIEGDESPKFLDMVQSMHDGEKDPREIQEITKGEEKNDDDDDDEEKKKRKQIWKCKQGGCISWKSLWIKQKQQKTRKMKNGVCIWSPMGAH